MELKKTLEEIKGRILGIRLSKLKTIIVGIVLIGILLTILLAGNVPAQNIQVVNGQQYLAKTYAEAPSASIGYTNAVQSSWTLGGNTSQSSTSVQLSSSSITSFTGVFEPSQSPSSTLISRQLFVNLEDYPIMFLEINVTQGIGYGIRFFSTYDNKTTIPLWSNSDVLNHRKGTGTTESIQVNLQLLAKQNTGKLAENITELQVYAERPAENVSTHFSIVIDNLEFLNYKLIPYKAGQSYHSVYFTFDELPTAGNSSWVLNKINLGLDISAAPGTAYEIYQLNGTSARAGSLYHYSNAIASYDYSLYPKGAAIVFPDSAPPSGGYSIVVVAQTGSLQQVTLQSVSFVFTPSQNSSQTVSAATVAAVGGWWYAYLIFFLFVTPLGVALFMYRKYRRDEEFKPWHIGLAIGAGVVCRLALAPVASQPFDISVYATSARGWFEYGTASTSLGPTLPFTFFLYWVPYSFYALLLKAGFHDFYILGHQTGFFETIFLKAFPMASDLFVCYLILKFDSGRVGKLFAFFYLLNPLSIYISSVWGQYEASTVAFIVLGFLFLYRQSAEGDDKTSALSSELKAAIAFAFSALIEIVGLIPLAFMVLKSAFTRPFKIAATLLLALPVVLLFVYPPELHLLYLIFAGSVGASSVLLLGQPHTPYTILSNFPQLAPFHPLVVLLAAIAVVFVARRKYDLESLVGFTLVAFVVFLLFSAQQPQWWIFLLPISLVYAIVSEKHAIGVYMLAFGTMVAFLILSFTQGSGYMLFGSAQFNLLPAIENAKHGIDLFTVTTTVGALTLMGYLVAGSRLSGTRPLLRGALILSGVLALSFVWFSMLGATL